MSNKLVTVVVTREELVARQKRDGRNMYEPNVQRRLIEACLMPSVSVSGMALAHGLNTNVLRKWLIRERTRAEMSRRNPVDKPAQSATKLLAVTVLPEPLTDTRVTANEQPSPTVTAYSPPSTGNAAGRINIEIGGARIVVDTNVDAKALSTVLDCLRAPRSR